jgi:hypothetical protein
MFFLSVPLKCSNTEKIHFDRNIIQTARKASNTNGVYTESITHHVRFNVSFILGPDADGVISSSMAMADIGGLVASGEGTAAGWPNAPAEGPRLKPRFGRFAAG